MADMNLFQPWNANFLFSPDQWSNQYSNFNNKPFPFPPSIAGNPWTGQAPQQAGDVGWPTDAMGKPIQLPKGVTLNTSPPQAAPAPAPQQQGPSALDQALLSNAMYNTGVNTPPGPGTLFGTQAAYSNAMDQMTALLLAKQQAGLIPGTPNYVGSGSPPGAGAGAPGGGGGAPAPQGGGGLNYQQYLSLLGSPGQPAQPGATVPQAPSAFQPASGQGTPISNFMANFRPAQSGPSASFQQAFANAMGQPQRRS
jgi:hypothetical protein